MSSRKYSYPTCRKEDRTENWFGTTIADPYAWFRDQDDPEVRDFVARENAFTDAYFAGLPVEEKIRDLKRRQLPPLPTGIVPWKDGYIAAFVEEGDYRIRTLGEDLKAGDELPPVSGLEGLLGFSALPCPKDDDIMALMVQKPGDARPMVAVCDMEKRIVRRMVPDVFSYCWSKADGCLYYSTTRTDVASQSCRSVFICYDPESEEERTLLEDDANVIFGQVFASGDGRWILAMCCHDYSLAGWAAIDVSSHEVTPLTDHPVEWKYIDSTAYGHYFIALSGTQHGALLSVSGPGREVTILPESTLVLQDGFTVGGDLFVLACRDVSSRLLRISGREVSAACGGMTGAAPAAAESNSGMTGAVPAAEESVSGMTGAVPAAEESDSEMTASRSDEEGIAACVRDAIGLRKETPGKYEEIPLPDDLGTLTRAGLSQDGVFLRFESFLIAPCILHCDGATLRVVCRSGAGEHPELTAQQHCALSSEDHTPIPYYMVRRKDAARDGNQPVLMYAYGGYNVSMPPWYQEMVTQIVVSDWVEKGGIYIHVNLRGGGEYGPAWHEAGMGLCKRHCYEDFIGVAEAIIRDGWTRAGRIGIAGCSNGGLLMSALVTMRPDLWGCVIDSVPHTDMIHFAEDDRGPMYITEYGNPRESREMFEYLLSYSPYHNIRPCAYPPIYVQTGEKDNNVPPYHGKKFAAGLQEASTGDAPILLRVLAEGSHDRGQGEAYWHTIAEMQLFLEQWLMP